MGHDGRRIPEQYAAEVGRFYNDNAKWLSGYAFLQVQHDGELAAAREHVADLVQDTFDWDILRVLPLGQQRAWLRTTLSNKEVSHFRRRVAFRRRQPELHRRYTIAETDPEEQALSGLALERAAKVIESLPARQRRIALLKWNDHMRESEIAAELGCSKGLVAAEVQKIRRKLIDGLGPYYPFAEGDGKGAGSR